MSGEKPPPAGDPLDRANGAHGTSEVGINHAVVTGSKKVATQKREHELVAYQSEERVTYQTLKEWALNSYFDFCRDRGIIMGMSHLEVIGYIDYDFEDGFQRPIEDLMWRVILLVLAGGWHSEWHHRARQIIVDKLVEHDLENLLISVPVDEAETFYHDLKILKLI